MHIVAETFVAKQRGMLCGSYEAEKRTYTMYQETSGKRWLVANQENAADNIYVEGGRNSEGFGGRLIKFTLTDLTEVELQGPWHTCAEALFAATGVYVNHLHKTYGAIALERGGGWPDTILNKVLFMDSQPVIGHFNRIERIAQEFANKYKKTVYYFSESASGSCCGPVDPTDSKGKRIPSVGTPVQASFIGG